jgi:hypothetical protein
MKQLLVQCILTSNITENTNAIIPTGDEIFSSPKHRDQLWCTPTCVQWVQGALSLEGEDADHLLSTTAAVKNEWDCISTLLYVFMARIGTSRLQCNNSIVNFYFNFNSNLNIFHIFLHNEEKIICTMIHHTQYISSYSQY